MKTFLLIVLLVSAATACSANCNDCDPFGSLCFACA